MKRKYLKIGLISIAILVVVLMAGLLVWTQIARYAAFPEAAALITDEVKTPQGWYVFRSAAPTDRGVIFYPGGLVEAAAYAPLMTSIAAQGVTAIIVPMPLDLAVLGVNRADDVIRAYPEITRWIIAGHSLGGAMAAQYVTDHPAAVQGLALLAAYPADNVDLSALPIGAVTVVGTNDGVARDVFEDAQKRLPPGSPLIMLDGGNHAQFGHYGPQQGDGVATLSREAQQAQTTAAILTLMKRITP